jgi:hypothetical protein
MNRNEEAATRYMAGATLAEIGRELGVTRERVRQILDSQGVKRRSRASAHRNGVSRHVADHAPAINASFDRTRNIRAVVAEYKGVVPAAVVREILAPRADQQEKRIPAGAARRFSDEDIRNAIVRAEAEGFTSSQSYARWRTALVASGEELPSVATITVRYGSWSSARQKSGAVVVRSRNSQSCRVFTDADIDSAVRRFVSAATAKGVHPSARAYDEWARRVGNAPLLSTVRARTGRKWSSLTYRPVKK